MNIKHVFFDLDHTLWDFEKNSALTFSKILSENNINIKIEDFLEVYVPLNFKYWKLYREEKVTKQELRYGRLKNTFDAINYKISDSLINKLANDYIDSLTDFNHLFDGTLEILDYLKDKYQLHIITNGFEEVQSKKMLSSKIHHYFDKIITSESVGVKKPNPKVFNFAIEVAAAKKEHSIMIGDNLEADIQGALNCGIDAIHCNFNNTSHNKNQIKTVYTLLELKQYL